MCTIFQKRRHDQAIPKYIIDGTFNLCKLYWAERHIMNQIIHQSGN